MKSNTWFSAMALLGLAVSVCVGSAQAATLDHFLQQERARGNVGYVDVIVRYRGAICPEEKNALLKLGGTIYSNLPVVNSLAVRLPRKSLGRLAQRPHISSLSSDIAVRKSDEFTVGRSGADYAFAQYGLTGQGVTVAVIDSGIRDSEDLRFASTNKNRIIKKVNFVAGESGIDDTCGHGTHVAGIIGGNGANSRGPRYFRTFLGVARDTPLVSIRVLNKAGQGSVSSVIAGIQWVIQNKRAYNIRVINLSLGHAVGESYKTDPLCQTVEAAWKAGIVVVCAAGNNGRRSETPLPILENGGYGAAYGTIQSPGNDPYVITVGAMKNENGLRAFDRIATYSSRGPSRYDFVMKPDIVAPGNQVISTLADGQYLDKTYGATNSVTMSAYSINDDQHASKKYFLLSGTSMAAPVVAGAAALLLEKDPALSPDTVKARLMVSADKWTDPWGNGDVLTFGAGYLNIPAALASTSITLSTHALTPTLIQTPDGQIIFDPEDGALSGDKAIWGTGGFAPETIWGTAAVGRNIIWGTSDYTLSNSKAIWGTDIWINLNPTPITSSNVDLSSKVLQGD